jgi:hypothetical protein
MHIIYACRNVHPYLKNCTRIAKKAIVAETAIIMGQVTINIMSKSNASGDYLFSVHRRPRK